ncbi:MAG: hypothetical protein CO189_10355 [candidate division Zixibacteria bacterium CG_4_9_14_3_um_filter_46_8]|nr:MAG: hypothetical protein CO189_10355 [candidate division Zixibacteria bacterium CG_4_9_14_3_um_filter_46_8]
MMKYAMKRNVLFISLIPLFLIFNYLSGCSPVNPHQKPVLENGLPKLSPVITDELQESDGGMPDLEYSLDRAEYFYALGVNANRDGKWEQAQSNFEKAMEILSEIDVSADSNGTNERFNKLLKEIEKDYSYTLVSQGILSDESSHSAFLEMFADIKNFKNLKEGLSAKQVAVPESVTYTMPIEFNERVQNSLVYLQTVGRKHFVLYLSRMGKYKDLMLEIIRGYNLPEDLVYLPLIESGFNPKAYSYARASGAWQFISSTGRLYGLNENWWHDERRDFVKSTHAACKYLKFLYEKFGDWNLALASYNCGEGKIERETKNQKTTNFWELRLKRQTMDYVPLFMAATIIAKDKGKYGFAEVELMEPISFDVVKVNKVMNLKKIASSLDISYEELKELNPQLMRDITPPNHPDYELRLPRGCAEKFTEVYESIPTETATNWATHRVKQGETLSSIAKHYGVGLSAIASINKIRRKSKIVAGQNLMIPIKNSSKESANGPSYSSSSRDHQIEAVGGTYTVRRGDTLWKIADRFGTTVDALKGANNLKGRNPKVFPGDRLRVSADGNRRDAEKVHVVRKGETLSSIAEKYNTTVANIRRWNNLAMSGLIVPGDRLKIYSSN